MLQRFLVPACLFTKAEHGTTGGLHQSPSKPLPSQNTCRDVNAVWMTPESTQQGKEMQKQIHSCVLGVCQTPLCTWGHCGQTRATAATWILFSACLSLPYHSHPFLGGKVALFCPCDSARQRIHFTGFDNLTVPFFLLRKISVIW